MRIFVVQSYESCRGKSITPKRLKKPPKLGGYANYIQDLEDKGGNNTPLNFLGRVGQTPCPWRFPQRYKQITIMENEIKSTRGGARKGAGRKCLRGAKLETLAVRVLPATKEKLTLAAADKGVSLGELIDAIVSKYAE